MTTSRSDITIAKFALKPVQKLSPYNTLGDAINLMQDKHIRHIPIVDRNEILGMVNPGCVLNCFQHDIDQLRFDAPLSLIMCPKFKIVDLQTSLFEVVAYLSKDPELAIVVVDGKPVGIYTDIDVLRTDFLWTQFNDVAIKLDTEIGTPINEFRCVSNENAIYHSFQFMAQLKQEYICLMESESKQFRGVISFFDIINHLYYTTTRQKRSLIDIMSKSIFAIFPSSGLYLTEPVMLTNLRREMYLNDEYFATILSRQGMPGRIISSEDIIAFLIQSSDYFG